eukprot:3382731-Prymnesium_polylepis.1
MEGGVFGVNTGGLSHYLRFGHHCVLARDAPGALDEDWHADPHWVKVSYRFRRAILFDGLLPHRATAISALPDERRRVVVGINVFDDSIGAQVATAPVHSDAYREAMASLQSFERAPPGVSLASAETTMMALEDGGQQPSCSRCHGAPPSGSAPVRFEEQWFCGVACLKAHRKARAASSG